MHLQGGQAHITKGYHFLAHILYKLTKPR